jgi:hypothetical protein
MSIEAFCQAVNQCERAPATSKPLQTQLAFPLGDRASHPAFAPHDSQIATLTRSRVAHRSRINARRYVSADANNISARAILCVADDSKMSFSEILG